MNAENNFLGGPSPTAGRRVNADARVPQPRLASLLDRAIVLLMAAIVLTLAWPVGMVLWHQSRTAEESKVFCLRAPAPEPDRSFLTANRGRTT